MVHLWFAMLGDHDELFRPAHWMEMGKAKMLRRMDMNEAVSSIIQANRS